MASYSPIRASDERRSGVKGAGHARGRVKGTRTMWVLRVTGALALLAMGALHLQQYLDAEYSSIPTIGTLFILNFVGALVIALGLLVPLERLLPRVGATAVSVLALGGAAMGAAAIVFLLISESTALFGFMEAGYRTPIVVALISEGLAVVLLGTFAVMSLLGARRTLGHEAAGELA
jgi:hypothetical protein